MSCYGAAGAVGFVAGLILGGLLTASLGWVSLVLVKVAVCGILNVFSIQRWIFRVTTPLTAALAVVAWFCFPVERKRPTDAQPSMDIAGACLGTLSMVLLTLGLSSSEAHGWGKAIAIAPIVIAVVVLGGFLLTERKVSQLHPISDKLQLSLTRTRSGDESCDATMVMEAAEFRRNLVCRLLHASLVRGTYASGRII